MTLPIKIRALVVCLDEAQRHGCRLAATEAEASRSVPVPQDRVSEYLRGVWRDDDPPTVTTGQWLVSTLRQGRYHDWCAASQGWAESQAAIPGERLPRWASGALRIWREGLDGRRGLVIPIDSARAGAAFPTPGALALFDRGGGKGHVERVIMPGQTQYLSVGGNEGGRPGVWQIEWRDYSDRQLLGFIECDPVDNESFSAVGRALAEFEVGPRLTGIDLSRWQPPELCDYDLLAEDHDFVILRASHSDQEDAAFRAHLEAFRGRDIRVGVYAWLDEREPLEPQLKAFTRAIDGRVHPGDILPTVDVEGPGGAVIRREWWRDAVPRALDALDAAHGGAMVYGSAASLDELGEGPWKERPLWLAHYTLAPVPRRPKNWSPWAIWQHRADTHPTVPGGRTRGYSGGTRDLDLNVARHLPTV